MEPGPAKRYDDRSTARLLERRARKVEIAVAKARNYMISARRSQNVIWNEKSSAISTGASDFLI